MITEFTPYASLFGGVLIGLGAVILMALNGRIAGMTAMLGGVLEPKSPDDPPPQKWSDLKYVLWHQGGSEHAKEEAHA